MLKENIPLKISFKGSNKLPEQLKGWGRQGGGGVREVGGAGRWGRQRGGGGGEGGGDREGGDSYRGSDIKWNSPIVNLCYCTKNYVV